MLALYVVWMSRGSGESDCGLQWTAVAAVAMRTSSMLQHDSLFLVDEERDDEDTGPQR